MRKYFQLLVVMLSVFAMQKHLFAQGFDEEAMAEEFEIFDTQEDDFVFTEEPTTTTLPKARSVEDVVGGDNIRENRYPTVRPQFVKPPGPNRGGTVKVPHPDAPKGLLRIEKDGSYQYKVQLKEKSKSASMRFMQIASPVIESGVGGVTYRSVYGEQDPSGLMFDYEWQPFRSFGSLGLAAGVGFAVATGNGFLKRDISIRSEEVYTLYTIPLSLSLIYRLEFMKRQFIVPYAVGSGVYFGMIETRDDNAKTNLAGATALGGGGGVMISLTQWSTKSAFALSQEYGIADMWLSVEAKVLQGLRQDIDFSGSSILAGIHVDF